MGIHIGVAATKHLGHRYLAHWLGEAHLRRQTARRPCGHVPQPTGHCPSSPGGGGARVPAAISAGQLARVHGGGDPEGTGRHRCPPASPEKGVWAPPSARRCRAR
ncbi:hypothetical protein V6Z98_010222 [Aspergillus fumigatus]